MLVGIFNRPNENGIELAQCVKYSQLAVDNWKNIPGNESLTDAQAFDGIVSSLVKGAQYVVINEIDLPPYDYYLPGATYDFINSDWTYDNTLIAAHVNGTLVPLVSVGIQANMDAQAQTRGYDNIDTASSYAAQNAVTIFHDEGQAFLDWRALVWEFCYTELGLWVIGDPPITANDLINDAGFPVLTLP